MAAINEMRQLSARSEQRRNYMPAHNAINMNHSSKLASTGAARAINYAHERLGANSMSSYEKRSEDSTAPNYSKGPDGTKRRAKRTATEDLLPENRVVESSISKPAISASGD